jgi:hypothetical protein
MARPVIWADVRCDRMNADECCETGPGNWSSNAKHISELVAQAKRRGWKIVDGQTVCPACLKITTI